MSNIERAKAFIGAWERIDLDAIEAACAPDIFYHNIPMQPVHGRAGLRAFAGPFLAGCDKVVFDILHIAETGAGAVLTERIDTFHLKTGKVASIRVMGTFEFDGQGLICQWRDYFDLAEFRNQLS